MILENMVLIYDIAKSERIRIIYLDKVNDLLSYVNLDIIECMPKTCNISKIEQELENGVLIQVTDPYFINIDEKNLKDIEKEKRNYNWNIIDSYWNTRKEEILEKKNRRKIFEEISGKYGISILTIKRLFSRFWQRGMSKNALLNDYVNSGGKGKDKTLSELKTGKPRNVDFYGNLIEGINITSDIKKQFETAIKNYFRNGKQISLQDTYTHILRDFFSDRYKENGEIQYKVWGKSRIPTYRQFYYWFKKLENPQIDIMSRLGGKEFDLKYRPLLSNSTIETDGPGTRFQVDATIADVYLVSSLDRNRIIGRPIVYAIIDVYSRLITGIYVGLEGPSWVGAMMALDNMIADKVEFCKKYDIDIVEEQWASKHLPEIIIADRGEFEGYSVENLINNLNIKIENTSPYRGDLKGIVERNFRTTNEKIKHKTPGAIQKEYRKRGDPDYRLNATLSLEEFTKIYINMTLHHNNKIMSKYPMAKEMIADGISPIPSQIWRWGIENKKGILKTVDTEKFRLNILPKGKANVSRAGIKFKDMFYGSKKAIEEGWFIKSKVRSIEIVYDPRNMDPIYILHEDGKNFEKCYLLEKSKQYKNCILEEIIFNQELLAELRDKEKPQQNQLNIDLEKKIEDIVKEAEKDKDNSIDYGESKNKRLKGIRNNRIVEKEMNREIEGFKIGEEYQNSTCATIIELPVVKKETESGELTGKAKLMEKLKKKRDESREK